jgi:uncharacterized protein
MGRPISTFPSIEGASWAAFRDRWASCRQRSSIESFRFDWEGLQCAENCLNGSFGVTDQRIWLNGLPEGFRGLRILQISDIHHGLFFPLDRVAAVVELSNRLKPDLVALTGDFVTYSRASIEPVAEMLGALEARCGVVAVLGNHDFRVGADVIERALRRRRIEVLRNRHILLSEGGDILPVAGVDDYSYGANFAAALRGIPDGAPTVLLAHNPRLVSLAACHGVSLMLSGHTHGGQINLPLFGTVYGRSPERLRFKIGWDRLGATQIYVSRGIGTIVLPWRLRCPAEIPLLVLEAHHGKDSRSGSAQFRHRPLDSRSNRPAFGVPTG